MPDSAIALYENEQEAIRAKRYNRDRLRAAAVNAAWGAATEGSFALSGGSSALKRSLRARLPDSRFVRPAYVATVMAGSAIVELPIAYLTGYRLERRYELTRQSMRGWLRDRAVAALVGTMLAAPLMTAANEVMRRKPSTWWLWLSAASIPVSVVLSNLAPVVIMPLFNQFEPLRDEDLTRRIAELTDRSKLAIAGIFQMDMSKQTEKANAFFTGVGNTKRIVIADTMLERYAHEEILGVVAHEAAHQVHRDIWTLIAMGSASTLAMACAVSRLAPAVLAKTSQSTGVDRIDDIAALPVLGIVAGISGAAVVPVNAAISRAIERRADRFALEQTQNGGAYASTMIRLGRQNLADPSPSRLIATLIYSHPPIVDRIERALAFDRSRGNGPEKIRRNDGPV
jgi:STE24 endopeptidase